MKPSKTFKDAYLLILTVIASILIAYGLLMAFQTGELLWGVSVLVIGCIMGGLIVDFIKASPRGQ